MRLSSSRNREQADQVPLFGLVNKYSVVSCQAKKTSSRIGNAVYN